MKIHNFNDSLAFSKAHTKSPWWDACYKKAFPTLLQSITVDNDGWAQRSGIDRILMLECGRVIKVDEKVREKDYGDILLEIYSDMRAKKYGWAIKSLDCEFIAYAIAPANKCYLFPTLILQKTLRDNKEKWKKLAREGLSGFSFKEAKNTNWTTLNLAVPSNILMESMKDSLLITNVIEVKNDKMDEASN
jgi:hypothetical protein